MDKRIIRLCAVCVTMLLCAGILFKTVITYKSTPTGNGITATGSASMDFESDLIVWRGSFMVYGESLEEAYDKIKAGADLVKEYLQGQQIQEDEMVFGSVDISRKMIPVYDENGNYTNDREGGYDLTQSFVVSSDDIDKVAAVSRDISKLIASGVELESRNPEYYCTRLDDIKMQLIEAASANAKERIDLMAEQAGAAPGKLMSANLGVFQITAANSGTGDYGATGTLDTASRYKTAMITVRLNYAVR